MPGPRPRSSRPAYVSAKAGKKATKKAAKKAAKAKRILRGAIPVTPDKWVRSDGKRGRGVIVLDSAPGTYWREGQRNFSKKQRHFLYQRAAALDSLRRMAESMGTNRQSLHAALDQNPHVREKMERMRNVTLYALNDQILEKALSGNTQLALRVLGAHRIFNETIQTENLTVKTRGKLGGQLKSLDLKELQEQYADIIKDD